MTQKIILFLLFPLCTLTLSAQDLVPYLCADGKYGISDDKGNMIVPCEFDEVVFKERDSLFIVKKGNAYGAILYPSCKIMIPTSLGLGQLYASRLNCQETIDNKSVRLGTLNTLTNNQDLFIFDATDEKKAIIHVSKTISYQTEKFASYRLNTYSIDHKHDLWRFKQKDGKVNFYHKDGYVLLKEDVINGIVLNAGRLSVEGKNGKLALTNLKGKALTAFVYEKIEATPLGQFIINSSAGYPTPKWAGKVKTGVLSNDGKLIIDTLYSTISLIHEHWYLVSNKIEGSWATDFGIKDKKGNTVLSSQYSGVTAATENYVIAKLNNKDTFQIINLKFPKKVVLEAKNIRFSKNENAYIITDADNKTTILGADFKEIYSGPFYNMRKGPGENAYTINTGNNKYILKKEGQKDKEISGAKNVYTNAYPSGLQYVTLNVGDSLSGLMDENYNTLFEPKYANIRVTHNRTDQLYILAKKGKTDLYEIHDSIGQKLDRTPISDPSFLTKDFPFIRTRIGREQKLLFRDGRIQDVLKYETNRPTKSANGKYLYAVKSKSSKRYYILDEELYNIIPEGYWIPKKYFKEQQLKTGLISVYNELYSGVIDAEGNWVIPSSYNYYEIYDAQTIVRRSSPTEGADLLIKKADKWVETKYHEIQPVHKQNTFRVRKRKEGTEKEFLTGIIDSLGNIILPLAYDYIEIHEKYTAAIKENKIDSSGISYIFDKSMHLLFEVPYKASLKEREGYIIIRDFKTNLSGVINFENEVIIPVKYIGLRYYPKSKHFQYQTGSKKDKTFKYHMADLNEKDIYASETFYPQFVKINGITRLMITHKKLMLYDENNQLIAEHDLRYKRKTQGMKHFITCEKPGNKQKVYVNMITGKAMME